MRLKENSPELIACIKHFKTIKPSGKQDTISVIDLVTPTDSPKRETIEMTEKKEITKSHEIPATDE